MTAAGGFASCREHRDRGGRRARRGSRRVATAAYVRPGDPDRLHPSTVQRWLAAGADRTGSHEVRVPAIAYQQAREDMSAQRLIAYTAVLLDRQSKSATGR